MNILKPTTLTLIMIIVVTAFCDNSREITSYQTPLKYEMRLVHILYGQPAEYIFVIGEEGFKSVDDLKKFVGSLPSGSELQWAPGCMRMGDEPLLSSESELEDFKKFCEAHSVRFVLIPSG